jgi:hypothetical protein
MSDPLGIMVDRIDESLDLMAKAPRMWGSPESMELQALLLLELRAMASRHSVLHGRRPSGLREAYERFVTDTLGAAGTGSLLSSGLEAVGRTNELHTLLTSFANGFETWLPADDTSEDDLTIEIRGAPGAALPFSAVCKYYENFQHGLQSLAKQAGKAAGMSASEASKSANYPTPTMTVAATRGGGQVVRLSLSQPQWGQLELDRTDRPEQIVRSAVGVAARVARWAGKGAPIGESASVSRRPADRVEAAFQTMKMLPPEGIASVRIGGRLVGAEGAVELRPQHAEHLVTAIEREKTSVEFDGQGQVRALDLDQVWFRIRSKTSSVKCWATERKNLMTKAQDALNDQRVVRVVGKMFRVRHKAWVIVSDLI